MIIVLDTDVSSLIIKHQIPPTFRARLAGALICVTFVTVGELRHWVELHGAGWSQRRHDELASWMNDVVTLPSTREVCHVWGALSAAATMRGRRRPQNDSWIAASCLARGLPLATRNVRDYEDYEKHHGLKLITG